MLIVTSRFKHLTSFALNPSTRLEGPENLKMN